MVGTRFISDWIAASAANSAVASRTTKAGIWPSAKERLASSAESIPRASMPRSRSSARRPARNCQSHAMMKTSGISPRNYSIGKDAGWERTGAFA